MPPLALNCPTMATAVGRGMGIHREALRTRRSGLRPNDLPHAELETMIGRVEGLEDEPLTGAFADFDCRNNRLARAGLEADGFAGAAREAGQRYGDDRVAVIIGSSTAGIDKTEAAYRAREGDGGPLPGWFNYQHTHNAFSPADFVRSYLGLAGIALAVATACSSSAKAIATAARYLHTGLADAAVVGGVDCLCLTTLYGFNSLELIDAKPCRPWDVTRSGISLGEAAGFALLEREPRGRDDLFVLGCGESSDAHHMSAPPEDGAGAARAIKEALAQSGLDANDINYVNLHGTGTPSNDRAEDRAVIDMFGHDIVCSATKGFTGHTLGACGIIETLITGIALNDGFVPGTLHTETLDPLLQAPIALDNRPLKIQRALSNSFGFGGSNCSVILGTTA